MREIRSLSSQTLYLALPRCRGGKGAGHGRVEAEVKVSALAQGRTGC